MSFPDKQQREKCWGSKDRYWECLDTQSNTEDVCKEFRKLYEASCPSQWVKHFDRKRNYLRFKERIEKHGYEPIDQLKS